MNSQEIKDYLFEFNEFFNAEDPQKCIDDFVEKMNAITDDTLQGQVKCDNDRFTENDFILESLETNKSKLDNDKTKLQQPIDGCMEMSGLDGLQCYEAEGPSTSKKMNKLSEDSRKLRLKYESDISELTYKHEICLIDLKDALSERERSAQHDLKVCLGLKDPPITTTTKGITTTEDNITTDSFEDSNEFPLEEPEEDLHEYENFSYMFN